MLSNYLFHLKTSGTVEYIYFIAKQLKINFYFYLVLTKTVFFIIIILLNMAK
jgi:hypothetical protein